MAYVMVRSLIISASLDNVLSFKRCTVTPSPMMPRPIAMYVDATSNADMANVAHNKVMANTFVLKLTALYMM